MTSPPGPNTGFGKLFAQASDVSGTCIDVDYGLVNGLETQFYEPLIANRNRFSSPFSTHAGFLGHRFDVQ